MSDIESQDLTGVYSKLIAQMNEIDTTLDATKDQKTAGKRHLRSEMIKKYSDQMKGIIDQIVGKINGYENDEEKYAWYYGIATALSENFNEKGDKYLEDVVESSPIPEKLVLTDEEMKALTEKRSKLYKHANTIRDLAIMFADDKDAAEKEFAKPKRRSGGSGVRGKRAISLYTWKVNGEDFTDTPPLVKLAEKYGYGTAAALRKAIQEQLGLSDLRKPPTPLVFNLPTGEVLTGIRPEGALEEDEGEDDEDDEDEDEDENNGATV